MGASYSTSGTCVKCDKPNVVDGQHTKCTKCSPGEEPDANQTRCLKCGGGRSSQFGVECMKCGDVVD